MSIIPLRKEYITLAQALKAAGLADTGGHAKFMIRDGGVTLNDVVETQPARKLRAGDRFRVGANDEWMIGPPEIDMDDE